MTRPDIEGIESRVRRAHGMLSVYEWDWHALLAYVAELEGRIAVYAEYVKNEYVKNMMLYGQPTVPTEEERARIRAWGEEHSLRAHEHFFERKPEVSEPSGEETKRDVDNETGNDICPWFKEKCICAQCQTDALACPMGIYGRVIGGHARTVS